jgi:hypothetical protein
MVRNVSRGSGPINNPFILFSLNIKLTLKFTFFLKYSPLFVDAIRNDEFLRFLGHLKELRSFLEKSGIDETTTRYPNAARKRIFKAKAEINKLPNKFHSIGLCLLAAIANKSERYLTKPNLQYLH